MIEQNEYVRHISSGITAVVICGRDGTKNPVITGENIIRGLFGVNFLCMKWPIWELSSARDV